MQKTFVLVLSLLLQCLAFAQKKEYKIACIGFYNLENLFDTLDSPDTDDHEFLPNASKHWTSANYWDKQKNMARVISELGTETSPDGVAILGVAEVENRLVLEDLVRQPAIADRHYQIVHYDSPDERGVDVGLIYQPRYFRVTGSRSIPLLIYGDNGERNFTRDILHVAGLLDGEPVHVLVNHWPSRRGGEKATRPMRNAAALLCKNVADSLTELDPNAKIIIMGDLNDDPISPSVKEVLACEMDRKEVRKGKLFNPMHEFFINGMGTLAYQDSWNLFDQIILSHGLVKEKQNGYHFHEAVVFKRPYLIQKTGQYKGYPFRTFDFDNYMGGFSDHFPVYVSLVKRVATP